MESLWDIWRRSNEASNSILNQEIVDPEFSFIFTISLDGKLDILDKIAQRSERRRLILNRKVESKYNGITREESYKEKEQLFQSLLCEGDAKCSGCSNNEERTKFRLTFLDKTKLKYFISKAFLSKAVLASWKAIPNKKAIKLAYNKTKKRIGTPPKGIGKERKRRFLKNILISKIDVSINIFSTGAISLLVRNKLHPLNDRKQIKLLPKEIIELLQYPNLAVDERIFQIDERAEVTRGRDGGEEATAGFLNVFAYEIASLVFNDFFRCLSADTKTSGANLLRITRVHEKLDGERYRITERYKKGKYTNKIIKAYVTKAPNHKFLTEKVTYEEKDGKGYLVYHGDLEEKDQFLILQQYKKRPDDLKNINRMFAIISNKPSGICGKSFLQKIIKYCCGRVGEFTGEHAYSLWNAPLFVHPYIGIKLNSIPQVYIDKKTKTLSSGAIKILLAMANQTEAFLENLNITSSIENYLEENSISKGSQDAIFIVKRGFIAAGDRSQEKESDGSWLRVPYDTLLFTFESTFSTVKSVGSFNKELEEYVSWKVADVLKKSSKSLIYRILPKKSVAFPFFLFFLFLTISSWFKLILISNLFVLTIFGYLLCLLIQNYLTIHDLRDLVNKARTLSPCEDFSSNIEPSLKSAIALRGSKKAKESLKILIDTVHGRLENYGHFLKTSQESLIIRVNALFSFIVLYLGVLSLIIKDDGNVVSWKSIVKELSIIGIFEWIAKHFVFIQVVFLLILSYTVATLLFQWFRRLSFWTRLVNSLAILILFRAPISNLYFFKIRKYCTSYILI